GGELPRDGEPVGAGGREPRPDQEADRGVVHDRDGRRDVLSGGPERVLPVPAPGGAAGPERMGGAMPALRGAVAAAADEGGAAAPPADDLWIDEDGRRAGDHAGGRILRDTGGGVPLLQRVRAATVAHESVHGRDCAVRDESDYRQGTADL